MKCHLIETDDDNVTACGRISDNLDVTTKPRSVSCGTCRTRAQQLLDYQAAQHGAQWAPGTELTDDDRPERCTVTISTDGGRTTRQCTFDAGHDVPHHYSNDDDDAKTVELTAKRQRNAETEAVRAVLVPKATPTVAECDAALDQLAEADGLDSVRASIGLDRARAQTADDARSNAIKWLVGLGVESGTSTESAAKIVAVLRASGVRFNVQGLK